MSRAGFDSDNSSGEFSEANQRHPGVTHVDTHKSNGIGRVREKPLRENGIQKHRYVGPHVCFRALLGISDHPQTCRSTHSESPGPAPQAPCSARDFETQCLSVWFLGVSNCPSSIAVPVTRLLGAWYVAAWHFTQGLAHTGPGTWQGPPELLIHFTQIPLCCVARCWPLSPEHREGSLHRRHPSFSPYSIWFLCK